MIERRFNLKIEAENISFIVAKLFGIDGLYSLNYVALHGATAEQIHAHMEQIQDTAVKIFNDLEFEEEQFH